MNFLILIGLLFRTEYRIAHSALMKCHNYCTPTRTDPAARVQIAPLVNSRQLLHCHHSSRHLAFAEPAARSMRALIVVEVVATVDEEPSVVEASQPG